jgi:hypothetical protein
MRMRRCCVRTRMRENRGVIRADHFSHLRVHPVCSE